MLKLAFDPAAAEGCEFCWVRKCEVAKIFFLIYLKLLFKYNLLILIIFCLLNLQKKYFYLLILFKIIIESKKILIFI
jgi:hypothetical protein